jgi:hypothetical protein
MVKYKVLKKQTAVLKWKDKIGQYSKDNFAENGRTFEPGDILPEEYVERAGKREIDRRLKYGLIEKVEE